MGGMQVEVDFYEPVSHTPPIEDLASRVWVAKSAGELIGFLSAARHGEISFVFVDPAHERCGVARLLIRAAKTYFDEHGEELSHGYPVSPKGERLMSRYEIEGRPLRPAQRAITQMSWSDEEATAKAQEVMSRILSYLAAAPPLVPTMAGVLTETVECGGA